MAELNETPRGNRIHIVFVGLRNAGKSTLVNCFTGQQMAIVSDVPGTTTDPVSKAMEILPMGPCLITDTAGLDDEGELGAQRVAKTLDVLKTADIAVWVWNGETKDLECYRRFLNECTQRKVSVVEFHRGDSVEDLKRRISVARIDDVPPALLDGLVTRGDHVLCVCPIDESAPKGRLILPQVQVIRECLDIGATCMVCQPADVQREVSRLAYDLVITDSQAFAAVSASIPSGLRLTGFSVLFARQKGDLVAYRKGLARICELKDGDTVLIAEGCTHHRQCNDIGSVKIPKALSKLSGRNLNFVFASGGGFDFSTVHPRLVVQCGGCMLTRREVLRRISIATDADVPIVNYGMLLAAAAGLDVDRQCEFLCK